MFINYLRLNLIRFFKGRSAKISILISAAFVVMIYAYVAVLLFAARDSINLMVDGRDYIGDASICQVVLMGASFFYVPIATGLVGCGFICSYYTYRSYYNLEIGMRNRTLFCISEFFVLIILCFILITITTLGTLILDPFIPEGYSMVGDNRLWFLVTFGMQMLIGLNDGSNALLSAKLFRRKGRSAVFYIFYWASSLIISAILTNILPTKYQIFNLILFPTFINWFTNDTPIFLQNVASNKYIIVVGLVIKIIVQMALSVMLFNRKIEEKKV